MVEEYKLIHFASLAGQKSTLMGLLLVVVYSSVSRPFPI